MKENMIQDFKLEVETPVDSELESISDSIDKLKSFVELYDNRIEFLNKENEELSKKYTVSKKIIDDYNMIKEKGSIDALLLRIYGKSAIVGINLMLVTGLSWLIIFRFSSTAIWDIIANICGFITLGTIPAGLISGLFIAPILGFINKIKYEELDITDEDLEVIKKVIEKNKNEVQEMIKIKPELLSAIDKLKELYVNKKMKSLETNEEIVKEPNDYKETYDDSYTDIVINSYSNTNTNRSMKLNKKYK